MAFGPISSRQIEGEKVKAVTDFIFLGSKLTVTVAVKLKDNCSLEARSYEKRRQHIKSRDITLPANIHLVKAVVFPVVMYGYESCTIRKAECQKSRCF